MDVLQLFCFIFSELIIGALNLCVAQSNMVLYLLALCGNGVSDVADGKPWFPSL